MALGLVADIGRQSVRFGVTENGGAPREVVRCSTAEYATFTDALMQYLRDAGLVGQPLPSALAIAGAVTGDFVNLTGSRWYISLSGVEAILRVPPRALNECAAGALALTRLQTAELRALPGPPPRPPEARGSYLVISPGTGLGVAGLLLTEHGPIALQSEAAHMNFAAVTEDERTVARALARPDGGVSNEAVASAGGILATYRALGGHAARTPEEVTRPAYADPIADRAIAVFASALGAIAGDLALAFGAWNGIFLTGAIARALEPRLAASSLRRRLEEKATFGRQLAQVPVAVVVRSDLELLGASVALAG